MSEDGQARGRESSAACYNRAVFKAAKHVLGILRDFRTLTVTKGRRKALVSKIILEKVGKYSDELH